jgi:pyruvate/2-oxoglutarate dehydrogenase complex dihydrolipoamide acyltransferase (E2) component
MEYDPMDAAIAWARERWPDAGRVLSRATYEDRIALVFQAGYKVVVPLSEIAPVVEPVVAAVIDAPVERVEVQASPAAVRLAKKNGLALTSITGTGKNGKVTVADVRKAMKA